MDSWIDGKGEEDRQSPPETDPSRDCHGHTPRIGSSQLDRRIGESTEADSIAGRIVSMSLFA